MKRFLLFAGMEYYPNGGWGDFRNSFDTLEEAKREILVEIVQGNDWYQIVDGRTGEIVDGSGQK